ncbi:UNVERIFIED_CONTAM: hypothetical protein FKN15_020208 [Acipenser sinensis]
MRTGCEFSLGKPQSVNVNTAPAREGRVRVQLGEALGLEFSAMHSSMNSFLTATQSPLDSDCPSGGKVKGITPSRSCLLIRKTGQGLSVGLGNCGYSNHVSSSLEVTVHWSDTACPKTDP